MDRLIAARMQAHGKPYTDEMRATVRRRAHWRARPDQATAKASLEALVREYWTDGQLTRDDIAERCHVTPPRVSQVVKDLGLPARRAGRRRK